MAGAIAPTQSATGLDFKSLLQIILQQLTYQDPLKPMDNFQFVSQLAQFSQLQQAQTLNTSITTLLSAQASLQATSILGKTVAFSTNGSTEDFVGKVTAIKFSDGQPFLDVQVTGHETPDRVSLSSITQILAQ